jgi:hypothetical protein
VQVDLFDIAYLLIVLLFLCEPKRPCMNRIGGPVEEASAGSWRWKARGTASRRGREVEKKRLVRRLHPGDLFMSTWRSKVKRTELLSLEFKVELRLCPSFQFRKM